MPSISEVLTEAQNLLYGHRGVADVGELQLSDKDGTAKLKCVLCPKVSVKNDFPSRVNVEFHIHLPYPLGEIEAFPDEKISGYPHQSTESRKLCLHDESEARLDIQRLRQCVDWTLEWLQDAATGRLAVKGGHYELPDFRVTVEHGCIEPIYFYEGAEEFKLWKDRIGQYGVAILCRVKNISGVFVEKYLAEDKSEVRSVKWGPSLSDRIESRFSAIWVLLPKESCAFRKRPPIIWGELLKVFTQMGVPVHKVLRLAERVTHDNGVLLSKTESITLLVGFSIPRHYGGVQSEVHWQPICVPGWGGTKIRGGYSDKLRLSLEIGCMSRGKRLAWLRSENISPDRLSARGQIQTPFREAGVLLAGCGALGSHIAEYLVRSGIRSIVLVDKETLSTGNLARHVASLHDTGRNKAHVLKDRLDAISPYVHCTALSQTIPAWGAADEELRKAVDKCDIVMEFTASNSVLSYLDEIAGSSRKMLYSGFFNLGALYFCLVSNGSDTSACSTEKEFLSALQRKGKEDAFLQPQAVDSLVIEGAGCWHATFPATEYHVASWAAFAVAQMETHYNEKRSLPLGVLAKRGDADLAGEIQIVSRHET